MTGSNGCQEWVQTSNLAIETITGFCPISISFPYDSSKKDWQGLGRSVTDAAFTLIDDTPSGGGYWCAIGVKTYHVGSTIPGPKGNGITKVQLFAKFYADL